MIGVNRYSTMSLLWVVLVFIAAGQGARAGELLHHLKRGGGGSSSSSTEKGNDVARLPLPPPFPVGPDNNVLAPLAAISKIGDGSAVDQRVAASSSSSSITKGISQTMVEKNAVPVISAKEEQAARSFALLPTRDMARVSEDRVEAIDGTTVSLKPAKEPTAPGKRITVYNSNVPPQMIIVYHHHHKRRSTAKRNISGAVLPRQP
ncbi:hypothetical protein BIW11_11408 [Tropilaelaps mercedesae]|uniref:Uncharacterized protein n=1 Tax=Tropilaelaps mercedesae TaxID=418985 RepID=A0A1V9XB63_9ACAR|nr:hypothetical protein BIW11_11408 [Tropilaelaps mercedesae]